MFRHIHVYTKIYDIKIYKMLYTTNYVQIASWIRLKLTIKSMYKLIQSATFLKDQFLVRIRQIGGVRHVMIRECSYLMWTC